MISEEGKVKRVSVIIGLYVLLATVLVQSAYAQSPGPGQPSWADALHWMVGPGAAVLAGLAISITSEYWAWFQARQARVKVAVYVGLCLFSAFVGTALAVASGVWGAWGDVQGTWWPAVWAGVAASGIGTLFHAWVPNPLRQ